jgi:sugar (pentulose or hexulose) kinase
MTWVEAVVGVDLGTTSTKVLVQHVDGQQLALVEASTPWITTVAGGTETTATRLEELLLGALRAAVEQAEMRVGALRILGLAVTGFAESGVLLDPSGRARTPVIAWFDRRGEEQIADLTSRRPDFGRQFVRRTGLRWSNQASLAKLLWFADQGLTLTSGHRWASIPEYLVHRLGGDLVSEPSLASRTGLLDQNTQLIWRDGVTSVGLPTSLLLDPIRAGTAVGTVCFAGLPKSLQGAALTVAGHDHPVAAIGVGATGDDELFNSTGTADVIARSLPGLLTDTQREELVGHGVSVGSHILPETTLILGGVRGGLLLRRVLTLLGGGDGDARDRLDAAALQVDALPAGLRVSGAGHTGGDVVLQIRDDAHPAAVWAAATRYTAAETRNLLDALHVVIRPHRRAIASGGWTRMASVRQAKMAAIEHLEFSTAPEPGVLGAAALALAAATQRATADLPDLRNHHQVEGVP